MSGSMMKAAVVESFGAPLTIKEVEKPEVLPGTVRVKIAASGVCHTFRVTRAWALWRPSAMA